MVSLQVILLLKMFGIIWISESMKQMTWNFNFLLKSSEGVDFKEKKKKKKKKKKNLFKVF